MFRCLSLPQVTDPNNYSIPLKAECGPPANSGMIHSHQTILLGNAVDLMKMNLVSFYLVETSSV